MSVQPRRLVLALAPGVVLAANRIARMLVSPFVGMITAVRRAAIVTAAARTRPCAPRSSSASR